jgi:hypothetical protein
MNDGSSGDLGRVVCGCEKGALERLDQRRDGRGDFAVPWYSEILKRVEKRQEERLNVQKAWFPRGVPPSPSLSLYSL